MWNRWGSCSKTCGGGIKTRTRDCTQPLYGGKNCVGEKIDTELCNTDEKCEGKQIQGYFKSMGQMIHFEAFYGKICFFPSTSDQTI